ncbi:DUF2730 family protein [Glaciimonas immobilis]|uniref:Cell division protein FtsB n=1 Tax=Glaciimonas immobilis TaxID=728004 RepID=A0A840RPC2_9BURK|nr:DUF2730 family protein [Glaciimonas immobilis]KAF3999051.1 DUF2730 family protein [Glaciimonas immobilis]MBB5198481.1 cell division protein FtsB [Glaciimonas immobilis]
MSDDFRFYVTLAQWTIMGAVGIYTWYANRQSAAAIDLHSLTARVTTLESEVKHLPDQALVNGLAGDMRAVTAELSALKDSTGSLTRNIELLNGYLLNNKK